MTVTTKVPGRVAAFSAAMVLAMMAMSAQAHEFKVGAIEIDHPWTRATPGGAKVAGGYMTIKNTGNAPDRLVGGSFAKAGRVEIHEMKMENDVMKMRELAGGLEIKPGETVELKPGSYHVMFMDLSEQLTEGGSITGTLTFQNAGSVDVSYKVEEMGKAHADHGAMGHGKTK